MTYHTIPYDSFEDSELLKKAGYRDDQIKIEILRTKKRNEELSRIIDNTLATKIDLAKVEAALKNDLAKVEAALKYDIALLQKNLLLKLSWTMGGMFMAAIAILDFLLKK